MNKNISIILVDDHHLFRDGVKLVLSKTSEYSIIGEASDGSEFLELLEVMIPDLVLMDIAMSEMDGIEATKKALKKFPELKIIALSSYGDEVYYRQMIEAGAKGFLTKNSNVDEFEFAIKTVLNGNNYFSQDLLNKVVFNISIGKENPNHNKLNLTNREKDVLDCICQGMSNKEIAEKLFISPKTVDNHRTSLLNKTSSKNTASLVMHAIKNKLVRI